MDKRFGVMLHSPVKGVRVRQLQADTPVSAPAGATDMRTRNVLLLVSAAISVLLVFLQEQKLSLDIYEGFGGTFVIYIALQTVRPFFDGLRDTR